MTFGGDGGLLRTAVCLVLLGTLCACMASHPQRDRGGVVVADAAGTLDKDLSRQVVDRLAIQSGSASLVRMAHDLSSLSDVPLFRGNQVDLLIDGPETYARMRTAMQEADHYIFLETYIFSDDPEGESFATLMAERRRREST